MRVYKDLSERLRVQAAEVEESGHCNACRLMLHAADIVDIIVTEESIVIMPLEELQQLEEHAKEGWEHSHFWHQMYNSLKGTS